VNTIHAAKRRTEITYDQKSFWINGRRLFLNTAVIHYFRMPREEWREVLVKAKLAGMNCVDTYFAWNVHEPREGEWNFAGDADCGAFLDLCAELGLMVIARPGPFICAEWDFGGFPWWSGQKPGIQFRQYNEEYLKYVDRYFDRIVDVIRPRQITQGGTVILVQVENEYGYLQDDDSAREYMSYLRDGLVKRGIEVPLITCVGGVEGAIEGANFWSGADQHYANLVKKQPDTPKLVTEFWTGWFEHWGAPSATQKTAVLYERMMMELIRAGFSGISHYMFFGGTNFAGYGGRTVGGSDIFMVTSYDYDAPLNEYGRTTDKYMAAKRFTYFVLAIESFLLESEACSTDDIRCTAGAKLRARRHGEQKLLFVESLKNERDTFHLTLEDGRTLPVMAGPGEIVPVLDRLELFAGVRLTSGAMIACNEPADEVHTVIVHAPKGRRTYVELNADAPIRYGAEQSLLYEYRDDRKTLVLDVYHFEEPQIIELLIGDKRLRFVVLSTEQMNATWRLGDGRWISGCLDLDIDADGEIWGVQEASSGVSCGRLTSIAGFGPRSDADDQQQPSTALAPVHDVPKLAGWKSSVYDLTGIKGVEVDKPLDFSSFSQPYGYLVYSSTVVSESDRTTTLVLPKLQDTARIYVNGQEAALVREVGSSAALIHLQQGANVVQILVQNMGRLNFSPFLGEPKGLYDTCYLDGAVLDLRQGWQHDGRTIHLDQVNSDLGSEAVLTRTFRLAGHDKAILVGALAVPLRVNGKLVPMDGYRNWFRNGTVDISDYVVQGNNVIEMPFAASPVRRLELITCHSGTALSNWRMCGIEDGVPQAGREYAAGGRQPAWHVCEFTMPEVPESQRVKLKLRLTGMSKGSLWLNGINLGRYWQIGPQEDYKLPIAWLKEKNTLVLFDEEGRAPDKVRLLYDDQSWRLWKKLGIV